MNEHPQHIVTARARRAVLAVMCVALMMVVAAVASLNVALPDLARSTGASQSQLQWIVDAYALVFAGLLLPAGALGDRYGRKGILQLGLAVFGAASLAAVFVRWAAATRCSIRASSPVAASRPDRSPLTLQFFARSACSSSASSTCSSCSGTRRSRPARRSCRWRSCSC
jgi:MFS family permease